MISKFSVRKPLTVFVAVILIIILGVISFTRMPTDLLPSINLPYVAVITTDPGASPEKVELTVTKPLEKVLSTTSGIEKVTSVSSENSSMIILQFVQGTNMDSVMIELSDKVDLAKAQLGDSVSSPMLMKINPDLLPVMIASVDVNGLDIIETSKLVNEEVVPAFERIDGVASVETIGLVEKQLRVTLDQDKIDTLNQRILDAVDSTLQESRDKLNEGESALNKAKEELESQQAQQTQKLAESATQIEEGQQQIAQGLSALSNTLVDAESTRSQLTGLKELLDGILGKAGEAGASALEDITRLLTGLQEAGIITADQVQGLLAALQQAGEQPSEEITGLLTQLQQGISAADSGIAQIKAQQDELNEKLSQLNQAKTQLEAGKLTMTQELSKASQQIADQEKQLKEGKAQLEAGEQAAYAQAGLSGKITQSTLQSILTAENFSMPAGYLTEDGQEYSVKVGDPFASEEELSGLVLFQVDTGDIGEIKLSDVADIAFADNAGEMYAKINGNDGILLSFQKQSTSSTAQVSESIRDTMEKLQTDNPDMHLTALNDQGVYINIVVQSVLSNLLLGGLLAILILFLFLRNLRPTLVVAFSIPISLMFAIVMMYFSGVSLNIISLAGLALGVGMLVDNSIVVIENTYRLRALGMPAAKAAVRGASQVAGAIASSTLTTVCVFLPIVFTEGLSRELFTDMGLTIAYSLIASLIIALTLVPALSSNLLKKPDTKRHRLFDRFTGFYGKMLSHALRRKAIVLALVVILLGVSVFGAIRMGLVFMPETDSEQIGVTMEMPKESTTDETRSMSDQVIERIQQIPDVQTVGAMQGGGMMMGGSGNSVTLYVMLNEQRSHTSGEISLMIEEKTADLPCEVTAASSSGDMSMLGGSGLQIDIRGSELDELQRVAKEVAAIVQSVEGTQEVSDGMEETSMETHVVVDKNKAMAYGLTVAQVYQQVAAAIQGDKTATTITIDNEDYPVIVARDAESDLSRADLKAYPLKVTENGEEKEITLGDIAQITEGQSLSSIKHDNQVRSLSVTATVDADHNIGLVSRELESKLKDYQAPDGYTVTLTGESETINETLGQLITMVLLAIVLIYGIMVAQFQSLLSPFIVMFTIPLAFTGGLLALWIFGFEISVVSMLGFLVLAGVVVNNGIVFVDYTNQLRAGGMEKREALVQAGKTRIRPILMTALTTILGLSTLAFGMGTGADMLQPMAVVTIGGLAYATLLTLFVVPCMYDIFQRKAPKNVQVDDEEQAPRLEETIL